VGFSLRQLYKQLTPPLPQDQQVQEWQVVEYFRVPGTPRWRVCMQAGAALTGR
jgi:hypothetical protein